MDEHTATEMAFKNGYKQGTVDAAQKIFAEIEKALEKNKFKGVSYFLNDFVELRKKYTEEGK